MQAPSVLVRTLRAPALAARLEPRQWDVLLRQARRAGLLPRLAHLLAGARVPAPESAQRHLDAAATLARAQREQVTREARALAQALASLGVPLVFMKGAAYVLAGLPPAQGRLFADLDLLVPRARLAEVEARLLSQGWATTPLSAYDQRYYREWMHELPPMVHIHRHTVLDVHHNILPDTARVTPDAALLIAAARPAPGHAPLQVLAPVDLVLHSMSHLFHNDDLSHALRDLSDLDLLLRHWGDDPAFWSRLPARAAQLGLSRPLHYGLRYSRAVLGTPIPDATLRESARWAPTRALAAVMDGLWQRALAPQHRSCDGPLAAAARGALYLRAHWLRMPPVLLVRHLAVKALRLHERPQPPQAARGQPAGGPRTP